MVKKNRNFVYFVLVAPILAKIIEWFYQIFGGAITLESLKSLFIFQIIFIVGLSLGTWFFYSENIRRLSLFHFASIVGIAYFLKEVYNLLFVFKAFGISTLIALTLEPIFMFVIVGILIPHLIFKEKFFK